MARLQVGLPELTSDIAKYAAKFDMVELRPEPGRAPRAGTLRAYRKAVNPSFTFSVVLPDVVGRLSPTKELEAALEESLAVAKVIEARCIVLCTPAEVRPTTATTEKLKRIVARLPRPSVTLCWEPRGIWERPQVVSLARELGVLAVLDATQDTLPPGSAVYTRLRALGSKGAVSERALAHVAAQLKGRRESWVVVEHRPSAVRVKQHLLQAQKRAQEAPPPTIVRPAPGRLRAEDEEQ